MAHWSTKGYVHFNKLKTETQVSNSLTNSSYVLGSGKDWGGQTVVPRDLTRNLGLNLLPSDLGKPGHKWVLVSQVSVCGIITRREVSDW